MTRFKVADMTCGHCKAAIETAVKAVDPAADLEIDLETKLVSIQSTAPEGQLSAAIEAAGFETAAA